MRAKLALPAKVRTLGGREQGAGLGHVSDQDNPGSWIHRPSRGRRDRRVCTAHEPRSPLVDTFSIPMKPWPPARIRITYPRSGCCLLTCSDVDISWTGGYLCPLSIMSSPNLQPGLFCAQAISFRAGTVGCNTDPTCLVISQAAGVIQWRIPHGRITGRIEALRGLWYKLLRDTDYISHKHIARESVVGNSSPPS